MIIERLAGIVPINKFRRAFTLVEVLIVLFIFTILGAIALPTVRELIADQKVGTATRNLAAFIDISRSMAIADSRPTGVLFERVGSLSDVFGRAASIRVKQIKGVPPYVGESSNALAHLVNDPSWPAVGHPLRPTAMDPDPIVGLDTAVFDANDSQLLRLSALMIANGDPDPPIDIGDLIEFPGGRLAPIESIVANTTSTPETVVVHFDLRENIGYTTSSSLSTQLFPASGRAASVDYPVTFTGLADIVGAEQARYKIYRNPVVSSTAPLNLPRGVVVDLNYSGIGVAGNEFAPVVDPMNVSGPATSADDIFILFGPDGKVARIQDAAGNIGPPTGLVFFCVGNTDGLRPLDLLSIDGDATANLLKADSTWLVINPSTGRAVASPFAVGSTPPTTPLDDPYELTTGPPPNNPVIAPYITEARRFALLSDTLDAE